MRFAWIEPVARSLDASESKQITALPDLRFGGQYIREAHVETKAVSINLAREPTFHAVAPPLVDGLHTLDDRLLTVGLDREREEVVRRESARIPQGFGKRFGAADHTYVDVAGGSRTLETQLE